MYRIFKSWWFLLAVIIAIILYITNPYCWIGGCDDFQTEMQNERQDSLVASIPIENAVCGNKTPEYASVIERAYWKDKRDLSVAFLETPEMTAGMKHIIYNEFCNLVKRYNKTITEVSPSENPDFVYRFDFSFFHDRCISGIPEDQVWCDVVGVARIFEPDLRVEIILNTKYDFHNPGENFADIGKVVSHETGHALGLLHYSADGCTMMCESYRDIPDEYPNECDFERLDQMGYYPHPCPVTLCLLSKN